jgi:hypothetical protein
VRHARALLEALRRAMRHALLRLRRRSRNRTGRVLRRFIVLWRARRR